MVEIEYRDHFQRETTQKIERYFDHLWPLHRSITGEGVRESLDVLEDLVSLNRYEVPSGTEVFDWEVPPEWKVNEAYVITPHGETILDVEENNLHLMGYSRPFSGAISRDELDDHLYSDPEQPKAIPFRTSYYEPRWGFCLPHSQRESLPEGQYEVVVDTEFVDGSLTMADAVLQGETDREILLNCNICHPSLANNELSGPILCSFLYRRMAHWHRRRKTFRFVYVPETIGCLSYLDRFGDHLQKVLYGGLVVTCVGDDAPFTYKRSRRGDAPPDRMAEYFFRHDNREANIIPFAPEGCDERQYCSPGFDFPVGSLMRSMYFTYPEYHTSLDDKSFISFEALQESIDVYENLLKLLDMNETYQNTKPHGEPRLDRYDLYPTVSDGTPPDWVKTYTWLLNYSDGSNDLLTIAERSPFTVQQLDRAAQECQEVGLLERS